MTRAPRARARVAAFAAAAALGLVLFDSCVVQESDKKTASVPPTASPAAVTPAAAPATTSSTSPAPAAARPLDSSCTDSYEAVRKFFDSIPKELGSLSNADADKLSTDTQRTLNQTGLFLSRCESDPRMPDVAYMAAKMLHILSARRRNDLLGEARQKDPKTALAVTKREMAKYLADVERLARTAAEKLPADSPWRPRALQLAGMAAGEAERYEEARKIYERFLELYSKDDEADSVTLALGRTFLEMELYDLGIKVVREGLEKYDSSEQYHLFLEMLWKLYHSKGDIEGMLEVVRRVEDTYPLRLKDAGLGKSSRDGLERGLDYNGFRKGYSLWAKGDFEKAREAFRAHIAALDEKEKRVGQLKPEVAVYRTRSQDCLRFLEELAGLPPPIDFDLGDAWATTKKLKLADAKGKTVAIVFRGVDDERSAVFTGPLSQWVAKQPDFEMAVVSFRKGEDNIVKQADEMRAELAKVGYEGAAGLDPDAQNKSIFRKWLVNVGSATFLIANRRGEIVWFQQDPRGVDLLFAQTLLQDVARRP